jgi:hypothetical protein
VLKVSDGFQLSVCQQFSGDYSQHQKDINYLTLMPQSGTGLRLRIVPHFYRVLKTENELPYLMTRGRTGRSPWPVGAGHITRVPSIMAARRRAQAAPGGRGAAVRASGGPLRAGRVSGARRLAPDEPVTRFGGLAAVGSVGRLRQGGLLRRFVVDRDAVGACRRWRCRRRSCRRRRRGA